MKDNWRLGFHLMPPQGWLNDPNGLCWYQGMYHVFFQYSPDNANGGLKHWGHYQSKDLIHWEFTGIPVKAEETYEKDGAYSGCAFVEDGNMHLFYTGNVKEEGDFDYITAGRGANVIHAIYTPEGTLRDKSCILTNGDYPDSYTCHVRDPKVWKEQEKYYMVLGGRDKDDVGKVLVYASMDLIHWDYLQEIASSAPFGYMWECPDYFQVGEEQLLSISPQGIKTKGHDYENIYQSGYYFLGGSPISTYNLSDFQEWDHGFDFYAPQTFEDEKGRRILVGWMGIPDADYTNPTVERGWQHALTVPRVLTERKGKIYQQPVEELQNLRGEKIFLESGNTYTFDLAELELHNEDSEDFWITVAQNLTIRYNKRNACVTLEFQGEELGAGRMVRHCDLKSCTHVQVLLDRSAVEVYLNHGESVMTSRYYPKEGECTLSVDGSSIRTILWKMEGIS